MQLDVSAIVCTWNCRNTIERCLKSLRDNNVGEVILVDASSNDGTREIASKYVDKVLTDPREGLARARNIGIAEAIKTYVVNVGADNIMPKGSIAKMLEYMKEGGYAGVSAMTFMMDTRMNYITNAMNYYKKARFFPGERAVIGTPTLFRTRLLQENPYDNKMSWSDDGDLCTRLGKEGNKFAIANVGVYEIGSETIKSVFYRWKGYGKSDWETYTKNSPGWNIRRKIFSITYPLRNELLYPFIKIPGANRFRVLPFISLITFIRYYNWIKFTLKSKKTL
ncbi:MAG TPA: glycosyltransferase family 2 protein [Candidatus Lokiarchaeia archaeon]|nr:glycosyltransferase family 2 protein [Candidatus Lokiarchaeia archaeon]